MAFSLEPFPEVFAHKGKYRQWDAHWNRTGYSTKPQYPGQVSINFPEDATPLECFLGGYFRKVSK